jgi:hypothetical protein
MAYGNDARLALTTHCLLPAKRLMSPIGAVTPPGLQQCSCSETCCAVHPVTSVVQPACSALFDQADPDFLGTVPCLTDPTIGMRVFAVRNSHHTNLISKRRSRRESDAPAIPQPLPSTLCASGKASVAPYSRE